MLNSWLTNRSVSFCFILFRSCAKLCSRMAPLLFETVLFGNFAERPVVHGEGLSVALAAKVPIGTCPRPLRKGKPTPAETFLRGPSFPQSCIYRCVCTLMYSFAVFVCCCLIFCFFGQRVWELAGAHGRTDERTTDDGRRTTDDGRTDDGRRRTTD